jgi:RNA polymerase sigma factor (sigma-70 family)
LETDLFDRVDKPGNLETGESFGGPKDYLPAYLASLKRIPKMSAAEEADLLARWHRFKDMKARDRVITATLRVVPPIAAAQARKFRLDQATEANKNAAKNWGRPMQDHSCFRDLIGEGNLALVEAFDAFPPRHNSRFEHYARTCVRNAVVRRAVSLLSAVDRPWGSRVKQDMSIDPMLPDPIDVRESTGCRQAKPTVREKGERRVNNFAALRSWLEPDPPHLKDASELPPILVARLKGFRLKDIARDLGVSIPTAHRRVRAAIEEVRLA